MRVRGTEESWRVRAHLPGEDGSDVSDEPLGGVEAQDSYAVIPLQSQLWKQGPHQDANANIQQHF